VPPGFWREVLRFTWPLWLSGQVFTAKAQLQGIWTGARLGPGPMGSLQSLTTMWQFAAKPIEYLGQAALPGLVSAGADRDKLYRELLRFCLVSLPVVGLCVSGGIPVVFQVIDWAYLSFGGQGQPLAIKYAEVPLLMLIPSLALPFTAIEMVTNQYSVAVGRPKTVFYAQLVNVAVMVVALLPLASAYGLYGVVLTGFLGELGNGLTFVVVLYKEHRDSMKSALRWGIWATVATALGLAVIYSTRDHALGFLAVAPAVLLYAALMALGGLLVKSDGERIIRAVRRRPASAS
jgi:O-antigen/teichoic acid export membrane protein